MKRWIIERPTGSLIHYYKDLETAKKRNPDAISIKECMDYSYLEYVDKIISLSIKSICDYKGRMIYSIPYNSSFILVRVLSDIIDGKIFYYDGLEFQVHNTYGPRPIMWDMGTPKGFCERFLNQNHMELPIEVISIKKLKTLKPVKFWFKNNAAYYRCQHGYFYYIDKKDLPNKKSLEEYEKFKGNEDAVWARVEMRGLAKYTKWFSSESELLDEYKAFRESTPSSLGSTSYNIIKKGYMKNHPEDRAIAFRLPYFQLDDEIKDDDNARRLGYKWCSLLEGHKQFGEPIENLDWVEDLIKRWIDHKEKLYKAEMEDKNGK